MLRYSYHCEQTNLSIQNGQFSYSFLLLQKGNGWFERLKNKKIFLFGTAGFGESEAYFQKVLDRVKESIDESYSIIGTFMCLGKMPMAVRELYEKMKQQPNPAPNLDGLIRNFARALTHPDDHDLEELKQAVRRGEDS